MSAPAFRIYALALVCLVGNARSSSADPVVIYSTFGPDPGFIVEDWTPRPGHIPSVYSQSDTNLYMMGFQLTEAAVLSSVTVPVVFAGQLPAGVAIWITPAVNGEPPLGEALESWRLDIPAGAQPRSASMLTAHSVERPVLEANALYFLAVYAAGPGFDVISWPWSNSGAQGTIASFVFQPPPRIFTGTLAAFQLTGEPSPVPEPATVLLLAAGLGITARRFGRGSSRQER